MLNLEILIERVNQATRIRSFYEQDTVERIVVPVIKLAGWDVDSIDPFYLRRKDTATRGHRRRFDLELHIPDHDKPKYVFECKSIKSNIQLIGKGASKNIDDDSDFARQLRNYCLDGNHLFEQNWSVPILTNGREWVVFTSSFTDVARKDENISKENFNDFIVCKRCMIDRDFSDIFKYLKDPTAEQPH